MVLNFLPKRLSYNLFHHEHPLIHIYFVCLVKLVNCEACFKDKPSKKVHLQDSRLLISSGKVYVIRLSWKTGSRCFSSGTKYFSLCSKPDVVMTHMSISASGLAGIAQHTVCIIAEGTFSIAYGTSIYVSNKAHHLKVQNCVPCQRKNSHPEIKQHSNLSQNQMFFFPEKSKSRRNKTASLNTELHAKFIQIELHGSPSFPPRCSV